MPSTNQAKSPQPPPLPDHPRILCLGNRLNPLVSAGLARRGLELGVQLAGASVSGGGSLSNGSRGFLEALAAYRPVRRQRVVCRGPFGGLTVAEFLHDEESSTAMIEAAEPLGLHLIPRDRRKLLDFSSAGLGDLIVRALSFDVRRLLIGIGDVATADAGLGMLFRLQEALIHERKPPRWVSARDLRVPPEIDVARLNARFSTLRMAVFCENTRTLSGPLGLAFGEGEKKGAAPEEVKPLDAMLEAWADRIRDQIGMDLRHEPGAGAGGGLGFACALLGGTLEPGPKAFCDLIHLDPLLKECDALVTCEGEFTTKSFHTSPAWHAAHQAALAGKRVLIVCQKAEQAAVEQAALIGVDVRPFAEGESSETLGAEAFTRLQDNVRTYMRGH